MYYIWPWRTLEKVEGDLDKEDHLETILKTLDYHENKDGALIFQR